MPKALLGQIQYLVQSHQLAGEKALLVTVRALLVAGGLVAAAVHMVGVVAQAHLGRVTLEGKPLAVMLAVAVAAQVHPAAQQTLILAEVVALAVLQALAAPL
jgi:hypothetical protein